MEQSINMMVLRPPPPTAGTLLILTPWIGMRYFSHHISLNLKKKKKKREKERAFLAVRWLWLHNSTACHIAQPKPNKTTTKTNPFPGFFFFVCFLFVFSTDCSWLLIVIFNPLSSEHSIKLGWEMTTLPLHLQQRLFLFLDLLFLIFISYDEHFPREEKLVWFLNIR